MSDGGSSEAESAGSGLRLGGDARDHVKNQLREYKATREKVTATIEKVANLINRKSYYSAAKVQASFGSAVKPSLISHSVDNDLFESLVALQDLHRQAEGTVQALDAILTSAGSDPSQQKWSCDPDSVRNVVAQMKQQLLLENFILSSLSRFNEHNVDQDALVTMIACCKFPPYLRESDLEHLLNV